MHGINVLIIAGIVAAIALLPFVWMKKPWALAIWRNIKLIAVIYVAIIFASGVARLIFNWDDIYG